MHKHKGPVRSEQQAECHAWAPVLVCHSSTASRPAAMIAFLNRPTSLTQECCFSASIGQVGGVCDLPCFDLGVPDAAALRGPPEVSLTLASRLPATITPLRCTTSPCSCTPLRCSTSPPHCAAPPHHPTVLHHLSNPQRCTTSLPHCAAPQQDAGHDDGAVHVPTQLGAPVLGPGGAQSHLHLPAPLVRVSASGRGGTVCNPSRSSSWRAPALHVAAVGQRGLPRLVC